MSKIHKIIISVLLSLIIVTTNCLGLQPNKACAAGNVNVSMIASPTQAHPNDSIIFTVSVDSINELDSLEISLTIPSDLTFVSYVMGTLDGLSFDQSTMKLTGTGLDYSSTDSTPVLAFECMVNDDATPGQCSVGLLADLSDSNGDPFTVNASGVNIDISAPPIDPTGISLNETDVTLQVGDTKDLTATISPAGATGTIVWGSNRPSVATVDNGTITAVDVGTAIITASIDGTEFSAACSVNVVSCLHQNKTHYDEQAATCTEAGHSAYDYCNDCGTYLGKTVYPAEGHSFPSAYESDADNHWRTCTKGCGTTDSEAHAWGALEKSNEQEPTCTQEGSYDAIVHCMICGHEKDMGHSTTEPLGHLYTYMYNSTKHWMECTRCHEIKNGTTANHTFVNGVCVCGYKNPANSTEKPKDNDYLDDLYEKLEASFKKPGKQTIYYTNDCCALPRDVMIMLKEHPDITLVFNFWHEGVEYKVTIPGSEVKDTSHEWYGALYLNKIYAGVAKTAKTSENTQTAIASGNYYLIKRGDTLSGISRKLNLDISYLAKYNNIQNIDLIIAGKMLFY